MLCLGFALCARGALAEPAAASAPATLPASAPASAPAPARRGRLTGVRGTIVDATSGETLLEARVEVVRGPRRASARTDLDGRYELPLPSGVYELRVSAELHLAKRVRRVHVGRGRAITLDLRLEPDPGSQQELVVEVQPERRSEEATLQVRRRQTTVGDAVSAQEISRSPDSSASDAVKRMVSATIVGGRYVVIRGLGGRYATTLLNNVPLPSPEPDEHAVPLDLFPAALLSGLTVMKSYSAEYPGAFAGGALLLETNAYPAKLESKLKVGLGFDSASLGRGARGYEGGAADYWGFESGGRALPDSVPGDRPLRAGAGLASAEVDRIARDFANVWSSKESVAYPNLSLSATVGDTLKIRGARLGYVANLGFTHRDLVQRSEVSPVSLSEDELRVRERVTSSLGVRSGSLGGLVNLGLRLSANHELGLLSLYTHTGESRADLVSGFSETDAQNVSATRLQFISRGLSFTQLTGVHRLPRLELRWQANASYTTRSEPDTRDVAQNLLADGSARFKNGPGSGERLFSELRDVAAGASLQLAVPIRIARLLGGGSVQRSQREFEARRFRFGFIGNDPAALYQSPELLFSATSIGRNVRLEERTLPADAYRGDLLVAGGFTGAEVTPVAPLRLSAGLRYELAAQTLEPGSPFAITSTAEPGVDRSTGSFLPAANAVWSYSERGNLRAAYSYTVARPIFRELAPFLYFDFARRRSVSGNPKLEETRLHNVDLRWEHFPREREVLAASLFYKRFAQPTERVILNVAQGDVGFANAAGAHTLGAELEARLSLARLWRPLRDLRALANLALIWSQVELGAEALGAQTSRTRPLQGQSPYVVNLGLSYSRERSGTEVSLLYNVYGPRIAEVGFDRLPDLYEEPFHRLDLAFQQELGHGCTLKLSATNLLAREVRLRQGEVVVHRYSPGVVGAVALEWSPERSN
jgi:outer membrane receptor protein involved in Fe transport